MCRDCEHDDSYMIDSMYAEYSRTKGLIPPEEESAKFFQMCGCGSGIWVHGVKVDSPSLVELQLANLPHQWPEMRKLQDEFYEAFAKEVTDFENDLLKALQLPDIKKVREDYAGEEVVDNRIFKYTPTMKQAHKRLVKELMGDLVGSDTIEKKKKIFNAWINTKAFNSRKQNEDEQPPEQLTEDERNSLYVFFMLAALGLSLEKIWQQLIRNLPDGMTEEDISRTRVQPIFTHYEFLHVILNGANRITSYLSQKYYHIVMEALEEMALGKKTVIEAARYIHKQAGEGNLWHWLRLTRTESSLAFNAAFNEQSKASGVRYEQWKSSRTGACIICAGFDGKVWEIGTGPQIVIDSHPNCRCVRVGYYRNPRTIVQPPWTRESVFDRPYTRDELDNLFG